MDRARPEPDPPRGAPMWIVTFTDMSSLLLTFFILILTFSSTEQEMLQKAEGSLQGAFGLNGEERRSKQDPDETLLPKAAEVDARGPTDENLRRDQVAELFDRVQDREIFDVRFEDVAEGVRVRISPPEREEHFALLSGEMNSRTRKLLEEIGTLFRSLRARLVVETHVDDRTWRIRRGASAASWTTARALDAAEVLETTGIAPERIAVSPQGDRHPVQPNDDGETARYANRRLEILVIPDDRDPLYARSGEGS